MEVCGDKFTKIHPVINHKAETKDFLHCKELENPALAATDIISAPRSLVEFYLHWDLFLAVGIALSRGIIEMQRMGSEICHRH